jgi:hypothetical protein
MNLKQLTSSFCLDCVDIRHYNRSIYTIINGNVVYFYKSGKYTYSYQISIYAFKNLPRLTTVEEVNDFLKNNYNL